MVVALGIAAFFVTFLVSSQPHRVHHLLENLPNSVDRAGGEEPASVAVAIRPPASTPRSSQESTAKAQSQKSPPVHKHTHQHGHRHAPHSHDLGHEAPAVDVDQVAHNESPAHDHENSPRHTQAPKNDANHNDSARTECTFQAAAHQNQLNLSACLGLAVEIAETPQTRTEASQNYFVFRHSPSAPRAPPRA